MYVDYCTQFTAGIKVVSLSPSVLRTCCTRLIIFTFPQVLEDGVKARAQLRRYVESAQEQMRARNIATSGDTSPVSHIHASPYQ